MASEIIVYVRNKITSFFYKNILKPIFFLIDPEIMHDSMTWIGRILGSNFLTQKFTGLLFFYHHPSLEQKILGIKFLNPIGLSAGFDKDARLTNILPSVGFGFAEVGSITGEPCQGNPKPRLWRLPKSKGLVVYYGLKNEGCEKISQRLTGQKFLIPLGISIAKTNSPQTIETATGIADYLKAFKYFTNIGDYFTINISCPNAFGGEPFTNPTKLDLLLHKLDKIPVKKPIFLKMPADLTEKQIDEILKVTSKHRIQGFICTNLTKNRKSRKIKDQEIPEKGGISGKAVEELANHQIQRIYQKTKGKYIIIGCGGVFSAEDAYKKIRLGASLIQLITGMVFEGPQLISEINQGLVRLLKKDGYSNISQAIGTDTKRQ